MVKLLKTDYGSVTVPVIAILLASFLINILIRLGYDFEYMDLTIYNLDTLDEVSYANTVLYVLLKRLKQCILIIVFMKLFNADLVYNLLVISLGFVFGILSTAQTYYNGFIGVVELVICIFPHYIIYLMLIYMLRKHFNSYVGEGFQGGKIMFSWVLLMAGVICEGFFLRFFLKYFYQYIVTGL